MTSWKDGVRSRSVSSSSFFWFHNEDKPKPRGKKQILKKCNQKAKEIKSKKAKLM